MPALPAVHNMSSDQSLSIENHANNCNIKTPAKIKSKIVKTYHHDIRVTYEGLLTRGVLTQDDSDPDETERLLSSMINLPGNDRSHSDQRPARYTSPSSTHTAKHSLGGISTIDSGVVSHESLLDRYRDGSYTRSERSLSPSSISSTPVHRSASPTGSTSHRTSSIRSEFDPMNKPSILDSRYTSRSRSRIEQEQRAKSPCRGHGVKQMINFFEGSPELQGETESKNSDMPYIKAPLYTTPLPSYKATAAKLSVPNASHTPTAGPRRSTTPKRINYTGTTPNADVESTSSATATPDKSRQDNVIHLTCVASGYGKYSPYNERKSYPTTDNDSKPTVHNTTDSENNKTHNQPLLNGAKQDCLNGNSEQLASVHQKTNGEAVQPHGSASPNRIADSYSLSSKDLSINSASLGTEDIAIDLDGAASTISLINGEPAKDETDRAVLLNSLEHSLKPSPLIDSEEVKTKDVKPASTDSPSKKNGEWFLKTTDNAQNRLLALCDSAQNDLDTHDLPDEVCGQIRAAIGKAHLLVNKKFKQFRGLCNKNLTQGAEEPFPTTSQDLAGFWDLVSIQVQNIESNFEDIDKLRKNNWVPLPKTDLNGQDESSPSPRTPNTPKSSVSSTPNTASKHRVKATPNSNSSTAAKARDEARKRLMAAKKAMKERRNSESEDVIFVS